LLRKSQKNAIKAGSKEKEQKREGAYLPHLVAICQMPDILRYFAFISIPPSPSNVPRWVPAPGINTKHKAQVVHKHKGKEQRMALAPPVPRD
jgi:hypothetical protein